MNKAELISAVATKLEISKAKATETLESIISIITTATVNDKECVLPGLGKLKLVDVKESSGSVNGKAWTKPAHKKIKLSLSKDGEALGN